MHKPLITIDQTNEIADKANERVRLDFLKTYDESRLRYLQVPTVSPGMVRAVLEVAFEVLELELPGDATAGQGEE